MNIQLETPPDTMLPPEIILEIMEHLDVNSFRNMIISCRLFNEIPPLTLYHKNKLAFLCGTDSYQELLSDVKLWEVGSHTDKKSGFLLSKYFRIIINCIKKDDIDSVQLLINYCPYRMIFRDIFNNIFNTKTVYRYLIHETMQQLYETYVVSLRKISELSMKRLILRQSTNQSTPKSTVAAVDSLNDKVIKIKKITALFVKKFNLNPTHYQPMDLYRHGMWVFAKACAMEQY